MKVIEILVPRIKPLKEWDDEDRKVFRLTLLAVGAFILGCLIPY